jgi:hypothetical protein
MQTKIDLTTPFKCYRQALTYVNECNPARAKYKHRIEPENSKTTLIIDDFSGSSATDKFVRVVHAIACVLADEAHERAQAWCWRNLIPRAEGGGLHVDVIAEHLHRSPRTVYRWLDRIDEYMIDVFKRRDLIPCDDPPS